VTTAERLPLFSIAAQTFPKLIHIYHSSRSFLQQCRQYIFFTADACRLASLLDRVSLQEQNSRFEESMTIPQLFESCGIDYWVGFHRWLGQPLSRTLSLFIRCMGLDDSIVHVLMYLRGLCRYKLVSWLACSVSGREQASYKEHVMPYRATLSG
jgi:hypothetical protein